MTREKKKKSKFSRFMFLIVVIAIVGLAWYFGLLKGFGLGSGRGGEAQQVGPSAVAPESRQVESSVRQTKTAERSKQRLEVSADKYILNGKEISLDDLDAELTQITEGSSIDLVDDSAIQNAYQQVLDLLNKHGLEYSEIKD